MTVGMRMLNRIYKVRIDTHRIFTSWVFCLTHWTCYKTGCVTKLDLLSKVATVAVAPIGEMNQLQSSIFEFCDTFSAGEYHVLN